MYYIISTARLTFLLGLIPNQKYHELPRHLQSPKYINQMKIGGRGGRNKLTTIHEKVYCLFDINVVYNSFN